ncbi:hypothetical protein KUCAC02_033765, partial [Chaenocephalus aceratus]
QKQALIGDNPELSGFSGGSVSAGGEAETAEDTQSVKAVCKSLPIQRVFSTDLCVQSADGRQQVQAL